MSAILIMTNMPDQQSAEKLASILVTNRLAACVNILSKCQSTYHWQGKIEAAEEYPLLIKTMEHNYTKAEMTIRQNHPYELPEIIAVPLVKGLPAYLNWIDVETTKHD